MYLLPLCEAREKHCPLTNQTCKGDMCMAWRWAELVEMEAYGAQYDCGRVYARRHGDKACPAVTAPTANAPCCNRRRLADVPPGRKRHKAGLPRRSLARYDFAPIF